MELAASTTYGQPDRDAIRVPANAKSVHVFLEMIQGSGTGTTATLEIQTAVQTASSPYTQANTVWKMPITAGSFSIATSSTGLQTPLVITGGLGDLLRFAVTANGLTAAIRFAITVFFYDT
jgi:hypothetical protein